jgi:acyl carrier protein
MINNTLARVVNCVAATTRYPAQLLIADADLEHDLGIDSVKRVEIVAALADEFSLELQTESRDPSIRTIGHVASWIQELLNRSQPSRERASTQGPAVQNSTVTPERYVVSEDRTAPASSTHLDHRLAHAVAQPVRKAFTGRVALITGSGRGVGKAVARVLAARGASVIVNSFHSRDQGEQTVEEIRQQGGHAVHIWGSVANPEHIERMFFEIEDQFGHLDFLVCNASNGRIGSVRELTFDDWDRAFRTNVSGHHQCAIRAARLMAPRGGGSIVTMSAVGAHQYIPGLGSQGIVKAAVESLTRYLACELGHLGIRVNCVAGGPVYGELLAKFPAARTAQTHWETMTPDGELCNPVDLAHTIAFLLSDEAHAITGAVWSVDHGFSAVADGRIVR